VALLPRFAFLPVRGLTQFNRCVIWDPMLSESAFLSARRFRGLGTGTTGFGTMTIITITTRLRGASG
jgi:hypothetical protein